LSYYYHGCGVRITFFGLVKWSLNNEISKLFLPSPILKDETEALESLEPSEKKEGNF
jgi:hypothetical protein